LIVDRDAAPTGTDRREGPATGQTPRVATAGDSEAFRSRRGDPFGPSSYGEAFADVYDDWYAEVSDVERCVEAIVDLARTVAADRERPPLVLELGIGTGRLALPLVRAGMDVRGIDASAEMVSHLRAKPGGGDVPVALTDLAALPTEPAELVPRVGGESSPPAVDVALIAFNTLFNLTDAASQTRCLARVASTLGPTGVIVVEAVATVPARDSDDDRVRVRSLDADRLVLTATVVDHDDQTITGQFVDISTAGVRLRPWRLRWVSPDQLDDMAAEAGLVRQARWGDWDGRDFDEDSTRHVSIYRRAP